MASLSERPSKVNFSVDFNDKNNDSKRPAPRRTLSEPHDLRIRSIRHVVKSRDQTFDVTTLPADLQRVYHHLAAEFGETYGLTFVFTVRTAVELHRAWNMTLLTSKILQQIKDTFDMRMTWNLGVTHLKFRVEDGGFELHRKIPYDYDSEYQDLYLKIAVALVEGHITVHEALIFQADTKLGKHTATSGLFLRDFPGRLLLYPLEAATCTVIFFNGDWMDAGVAAVCGLAAGLVEFGLGFCGRDAKVLVDLLVGFVTGAIGGLFYRFVENEDFCLSAIFLGTLYWFFYGTAFVIGLLEIIGGELETGVTRFIAVSVKTFVLTLGASIGLQATVPGNVYEAWVGQDAHCGTINLEEVWWRIPLYLLCSVSVLGQYRFPIVYYWRGLIVQLAGYEVQYQMFTFFGKRHERDFLDTAVSNILGAATSVVVASVLVFIVGQLGYYYSARLLQRDNGRKFSKFGEFMYLYAAWYVRLSNWLGIGKKSSLDFLKMEEKLKQHKAELMDPNHPRSEIVLEPKEEAILLEAVVDAEPLSVWSILMPAVYQLVPGSLIAKLWFNAVFPPPLVEEEKTVSIAGTDFTYTDVASNPVADEVFYGLFVISTSLALGLVVGFALVQVMFRALNLFSSFCPCIFHRENETQDEEELEKERVKRMKFRQQGIMPDLNDADDPDAINLVMAKNNRENKEIGKDRVARTRSVEYNAGPVKNVSDDDDEEVLHSQTL